MGRLAVGFLVRSSETDPMPAALHTLARMPVASRPRFWTGQAVVSSAWNQLILRASVAFTRITLRQLLQLQTSLHLGHGNSFSFDTCSAVDARLKL